MQPVDASTPPHKTKYFWVLVICIAALSIIWRLTQPTILPLPAEIATDIISFLLFVTIVWFGIRRAQRGQTRPGKLSIVLIIIAIICFILAQLFQKHP